MIKKIVITVILYGLAQGLLALSSPLLSRLYTPDDFALYGYIFTFATMVFPLLCFRYEYAIPLIASWRLRKQFFLFCMHLSFVSSIIAAIVLYVFLTYKGFHSSSILVLVFCTIFFQAAVTISGMPLLSQGKTNQVAQGKLVQNIGMLLFQILVPLIFYMHSGYVMVIGLCVGLSFTSLFYRYIYKDRLFFRFNYKPKVIRFLLKKHYRFPLFSSWATFLNNLAAGIPVFFIGGFYGEDKLGLYYLVYRVFSAPTGLLSTAVSQVLIKEFADREREKLSMMPVILKVSLGLLLIAIFYFFCMQWIGKYAGFIFGQAWLNSGPVIQIMAYAICIMLVASPLSIVFIIIRKNALASIWQVLYVLSAVSTMLIMRQYDYLIMLKAFAIVCFCLYVLYWLMIFVSVYRRDLHLCVLNGKK